MIPIFANLPPPTGNDLLIWLGCLTAMLTIALLVKSLFFAQDKVPQPLRTQRETRMATWDEVQQVRSEFQEFKRTLTTQHDHLEAKLEDLRAETLDAGEKRASKIHERIDGLAASVNKLCGLCEARHSRS